MTKPSYEELEPKHEHKWIELRRVTVPDANGKYMLQAHDGSMLERVVPSAWSECACGDSLIAPASSCLLCGYQKDRACWMADSSAFVCTDCSYQRTKVRELDAELARVRGLLQRQWISVEERLPDEKYDLVLTATSEGFIHVASWEPQNTQKPGWSWWVADEDGWMMDGAFTHWQPLPDPPTFPQSSSLVSQGAESADIGKLEAADKSCAHLNCWTDGDKFYCPDCKIHFGNVRLMTGKAGSAETGGEKAAPGGSVPASGPPECHCPENTACVCKVYFQEVGYIIDEFCGGDNWTNAKRALEKLARSVPNFPRSSQSETVSSGVEGAHEGTTADKSGSREPWCPECCTESGKTEYGECTNSFHKEPEKLNNAQKSYDCICSNGHNEECRSHNMALTESSLSQYTSPTENNGTSMNGFNNLARKSEE